MKCFGSAVVCFLTMSMQMSCLYADSWTMDALKHVELAGSIGSAWFHANPDHTLLPNNAFHSNLVYWPAFAKTTPLYHLGLGYHFWQERLVGRAYFNDFLATLSWYYSAPVLQGLVAENGQYQPNGPTFAAPLTSQRWMLDIKPGLFTLFHITPYPILGYGVTYNRISYQETYGQTRNYVSLQAKTNTMWTYDLGVGLFYEVAAHIRVSVEYIYTNLNTLRPSTQSASPLASSVVRAAGFATTSQNLLFGLGWIF